MLLHSPICCQCILSPPSGNIRLYQNLIYKDILDFLWPKAGSNGRQGRPLSSVSVKLGTMVSQRLLLLPRAQTYLQLFSYLLYTCPKSEKYEKVVKKSSPTKIFSKILQNCLNPIARPKSSSCFLW